MKENRKTDKRFCLAIAKMWRDHEIAQLHKLPIEHPDVDWGRVIKEQTTEVDARYKDKVNHIRKCR